MHRLLVLGQPGECEVANRHRVRAGVARPRVAAAIAEGVELLHVADGERGLLGGEGAQPNVEGAMRQRIERARRQPHEVAAARRRDQDLRRVFLDRDDGGDEADLDLRAGFRGHGRKLARRAGASGEGEPERLGLVDHGAAADLRYRLHHAALAAEAAVGERHETAIGRGGGRGGAQRLGDLVLVARRARARRR